MFNWQISGSFGKTECQIFVCLSLSNVKISVLYDGVFNILGVLDCCSENDLLLNHDNCDDINFLNDLKYNI